MAGGDGFDGWLEQELQDEAANASGPSSIPAQARYHAAYLQGGQHMSVFAKAAAVVTAKGALGIVVGALAVSAAGMAGEASISGSLNPTNWGQQVVKQVQTCKSALASGERGIGECVSAFAKQHGQQVSADHRASGARENHPDNAKGHGKGSSNGNNGNNPNGHPTGPPTGHPGHPSNAGPKGQDNAAPKQH